MRIYEGIVVGGARGRTWCRYPGHHRSPTRRWRSM